MDPSVDDQAAFTFALAPTIGGEHDKPPGQERLLVGYLARALGRPVRLVWEPSYAAMAAALREGRVDAAMVGPAAGRRAEQEGGVEPLLAPLGPDASAATYQSAFVTRIDSGLHDLGALRGQTLGLVDEQSTSGFLVPRAMLREAGLDPDHDLAIRLLGRHRLVVEAVLAGQVAAGACHASRLLPPTLERGPDYARLRVLARSHPIPLGPLVVREDLPADVRVTLATALLRVHETDPAAAAALLRQGFRFTLAGRTAAPTLKSIAALAGVSYATVSRVVNGAGYVAPATTARVAAIVKELGYRPNGNALSLQGQRPPLVGLVTPSPPDAAAGALGETLRAELTAAGIPLVLCPVAGPVAASPVLDLLLEGRLGALVVTPPHAHEPAVAEVARTGHAVVSVGLDPTPPGMIRAEAGDAGRAVLAALGRTAVTSAESVRVAPFALTIQEVSVPRPPSS